MLLFVLLAQASVLAVNYRLAPMVGFDEILEDAVEAFDFLLQRGVPAHRIVLAGDSAGGHLALSLAAHLAELRPKDVPGASRGVAPTLKHLQLTQSSFQNHHALQACTAITSIAVHVL